ncbi:hypothetical protein VTN02DRAFT_2784 [Thermoascus thermophilus]
MVRRSLEPLDANRAAPSVSLHPRPWLIDRTSARCQSQALSRKRELWRHLAPRVSTTSQSSTSKASGLDDGSPSRGARRCSLMMGMHRRGPSGQNTPDVYPPRRSRDASALTHRQGTYEIADCSLNFAVHHAAPQERLVIKGWQTLAPIQILVSMLTASIA